MIAKVKVKVGSAYEFIIEEKDEMDTLNKVITLGNPPRYCNECGNKDFFTMDSNKDKEGNTYVNVVCTAKGCYAKAKLGQYKTGGYFWHKFSRYVPKESTEN